MDKAGFILNLYEQLGLVPEIKPGYLEVFGLRFGTARVNYFDDLLGVIFNGEKEVEVNYWEGTTRPGKDSLLKPVNPNGTAIVVPGQYKDAYELGSYKDFVALKQVAPIKIYRDANYDEKWDTKSVKVEEGLFGIHIHRAGLWSKIVGPYSAGCQVFRARKDFDEFLSYIKRAWSVGQDRFTYTLLEI